MNAPDTRDDPPFDSSTAYRSAQPIDEPRPLPGIPMEQTETIMLSTAQKVVITVGAGLYFIFSVIGVARDPNEIIPDTVQSGARIAAFGTTVVTACLLILLHKNKT